MTVAKYLEEWTVTTLSTSEATGARRPSTVALHRWAVKKHLAPRLDKVKLARIGKGDVDRLVADLLASA